MSDNSRYGPGIKQYISTLEELIPLYYQLEKDERLALGCMGNVVSRKSKKLIEKIEEGFAFFKERLKPYTVSEPEQYKVFACETTNEISDRRSDRLLIEQDVKAEILNRPTSMNIMFFYIDNPYNYRSLGFNVQDKRIGDHREPFVYEHDMNKVTKSQLEQTGIVPCENSGFDKYINRLALEAQNRNSEDAFDSFLQTGKRFTEEELVRRIEEMQGNPDNLYGYTIKEALEKAQEEEILKKENSTYRVLEIY
ncbi:MAG: hypothetical protein ACLFTH_00780 [Candidatus Woesearchaeota archaeon]